MDWITPMEPVLVPEVITGAEWLHEIKWDGIRGLSYIENGRIRIFTRRRNERTPYYPELSVIPGILDAQSAVLDGEIIILDDKGSPSFYSSLVRERVTNTTRVAHYMNRYPAKYVIFDMLYRNGQSLTQTPLRERREILRQCLKSSENITLTDQFEDGRALYEMMKKMNWEGIVSKKSDSAYIGGKSHELWFKTKITRKLLAFIGGLHWKEKLPKSLLIGAFFSGSPIYLGKVSLGLSQKHLLLLKEQYQELQAKECPFSGQTINEPQSEITWFRPALTCWVSFMEFTPEGVLRHPKIIGFSKSPVEEANGEVYSE